MRGKDGKQGKIESGPDPLEKFRNDPESFSENTIQELENALKKKEDILTERYKNFPEGIERVRKFFTEERVKLQKIQQKLIALQKEYEGKRMNLRESVKELMKPFLDAVMASTASMEQGIDQSIEEQNRKIADAVLQASQLASQNPGLTVGGVCEQYSDAVKKIAMQFLTGVTKNAALNWQEPLADGVTKALRGKRLSELNPGEVASAGIQPGMVFYVASKEKYAANGMQVGPGSNGVIPKINETDRHWFTALDNGLFADNLKAGPQTLAEIQGSVGNRIVMNVHDPYQSLRGSST